MTNINITNKNAKSLRAAILELGVREKCSFLMSACNSNTLRYYCSILGTEFERKYSCNIDSINKLYIVTRNA